MLGGFEGNQRGVQPLPLPIGLPVAPTPGVAGDAVHKFVVPEVLRALVVISAGRAWSPNEREADSVIIRLIGTVLAVGEDRGPKFAAYVCQVNPLVRGNFKFFRLCRWPLDRTYVQL